MRRQPHRFADFLPLSWLGRWDAGATRITFAGNVNAGAGDVARSTKLLRPGVGGLAWLLGRRFVLDDGWLRRLCLGSAGGLLTKCGLASGGSRSCDCRASRSSTRFGVCARLSGPASRGSPTRSASGLRGSATGSGGRNAGSCWSRRTCARLGLCAWGRSSRSANRLNPIPGWCRRGDHRTRRWFGRLSCLWRLRFRCAVRRNRRVDEVAKLRKIRSKRLLHPDHIARLQCFKRRQNQPIVGRVARVIARRPQHVVER